MLNQLVKNTNFSFISNFIRIFSNIILFSLIARVLGVEDFGKFTFAMTFTTIFLYVANFGLDRVTIIDISRDNSLIDNYFGNLMVTKAVISIITFLIILFIINILDYSYKTKLLVYILTIAMLFTSYTNILCAIFRGFEKLEYESIVTFMSNLILLIITFVFVMLGSGIISIAIVYLISRIVSFIHSLLIYNYKIKVIHFKLSYNFSKIIFKKAIPFALLTIFIAILSDIDTILISYLCNDRIVGYYQSSMKIITALTVIPHILDSSFFPTLSKSYVQNNDFKKLCSRLITILVYIGAPLMVAIIILADKIILLIYGNGFKDAITIFKLLSIVLFLRFIIKGYETILLTVGKQNIITYIIFILLILNIFFNFLLIPSYGMIGAAVSAIITHILIFISYFFIIKRFHNIFIIEKIVIQIFLSSFISGYLIYIMRNNSLFVLIPLYCFSYFFITLYLLYKESSWFIQKLSSHISFINKIQ